MPSSRSNRPVLSTPHTSPPAPEKRRTKTLSSLSNQQAPSTPLASPPCAQKRPSLSLSSQRLPKPSPSSRARRTLTPVRDRGSRTRRWTPQRRLSRRLSLTHSRLSLRKHPCHLHCQAVRGTSVARPYRCRRRRRRSHSSSPLPSRRWLSGLSSSQRLIRLQGARR